MLGHVTQQAIIWRMIAGGIGILLPILVLLIWKKRTGSKIKPAVVGAIVFVLFAQILEGIPKFIFFAGVLPISDYVWSHTWTYVMTGCLLAGIFEEVGRYVAFRFFLRKYQDRKDAITYGIGHGGIESILVLGIAGISSIGMAAVINNGSMEQSLANLSMGQARSIELQVAAIVGYGAVRMLLEVLERVVAMTLHIALSVIVFQSVRAKKIGFLFLAILLHACFDIPAALYQCSVLTIGTAEIWLLCNGIIVALIARIFYHKMKGEVSA